MLSHVHGALCAIAVVCIFPLGAIILRTSPWYPVSIHMWTQVVGFAVYLAGFAVSVVLWTQLVQGFQWTAGPHGQLGVAVSACVLIQTLLGLWNHWLYRKRYDRFIQGQITVSPRRSSFAWIHITLGWFIVIGGIVNGAIGKRLWSVATRYAKPQVGISHSTAGFHEPPTEERAARIVYNVLAGVVGAIFCTILGWRWLRYSSGARRCVVVQAAMPPEEETQDQVMELREARGTTVAHI
jgi:hypothetical protein